MTKRPIKPSGDPESQADDPVFLARGGLMPSPAKRPSDNRRVSFKVERLHGVLDLDALERRAIEVIARTYGPMLGDFERMWIQKGIEGMRLAVAEALLNAR